MLALHAGGGDNQHGRVPITDYAALLCAALQAASYLGDEALEETLAQLLAA